VRYNVIYMNGISEHSTVMPERMFTLHECDYFVLAAIARPPITFNEGSSRCR
jgi:hypothetical protein